MIGKWGFRRMKFIKKKKWLTIQIVVSVCGIIAGIMASVLGILAILERMDIRYAIMGVMVCVMVSGINCAIAVLNLKKCKK